MGASLFLLQAKRIRVLSSLVERMYRVVPYALSEALQKTWTWKLPIEVTSHRGMYSVIMWLGWIPKRATALQGQKA